MYTIHIDEKTVCISNEAAYKAFCREFKEVDAAGGLVQAPCAQALRSGDSTLTADGVSREDKSSSEAAGVAGEGAEQLPQPALAARTIGSVRSRAEMPEREIAGQDGNDGYLFIRRNGLWDLPKGHREAGEDIETTALREVSEETGIALENLTIDRSRGRNGLLGITDHCYLRNGLWHLKHTWWYAMKLVHDTTSGEGNCSLTPQTEEGITDALWLTSNEIFPKMPNAYSSIRDVVRAAFSTPAPRYAVPSEHSGDGSHSDPPSCPDRE